MRISSITYMCSKK